MTILFPLRLLPGLRLPHQIPNELANPLMIEKNGHASRADVNGHAISNYQGIGMVYLEAVSVHQRHGKWPVRFSLLQRFQNVIEVSRLHQPTFFLSSAASVNAI
jgi:hypothetical protein